MTQATNTTSGEQSSVVNSSTDPATTTQSIQVLRQQNILSREIRERKRAEQITQTMFMISSAVNSSKNLQELYRSIHIILGDVIDLTNFFIALYSENTGRVSFPYFIDQYDSGHVYADQINRENSLTGSVIKKAAPVFYTEQELLDKKRKNRLVGTPPLVWIGIPLKIKDSVIGIISTQSYDNPNLFDQLDLDTLVSVSDQIALAIERKQIEEALIASEKKYRNILESIDDSYFEIDTDLRLSLVNRAICQILGEPAEDLIGSHCSKFISPLIYHKVEQLVKDLIQDDENGKIIEIELSPTKGEKRYIEAAFSLRHDETGKIIGIRGIGRDITQKKQAEKNRKLLEEQLQQAQRLESLGTLAGGIAHDFNNLLMGIQGRIDLMRNDLPQDHPHSKQLENIETCVERAANLTSRLLGFARGGKYELQPTDVNKLIEESITIFGRAKKEITITTHFDRQACIIDASSNQIEQVLLNLLVNSAQAMAGNGTISISTCRIAIDETRAEFHTIVPGQYIQITMTDTGKGIAKEHLPKIFDPFFTTKSLGGGTGLGLSMVYGIIRNHLGAITVESELHQGACFTIYLPESSEFPFQPTEIIQKTEKGSELILLVDDEEMITGVGKEMLAALGYSVMTAASGFEAIEIAQALKNDIDLVIIDMIMPKMSGGELFDQLMQINPQFRTVLSSGYSVEGDAQKILDRGCRGFIQKPFNLSKLSEKIREILRE
jgi:two-component system cell cycle sensor histidine kinase/response regulator CckA